jgi:NADPH:quinone reductase-like Zn-dependent oxidoreductase
MLESFEGSPSIVEIAKPEPGEDELLVRVVAAAINPADVAIGKGLFKGRYEHEFPVTLGRDFAGVVEAVGTKVASYAVGDEVFGFVATSTDQVVHAGSFADYIVVAETSAVAIKPPEISFAVAAALPLSGTVSLLAVDAVCSESDGPIVIAGATGGVGRYTVALAAERGAVVIATGLPADEQDLLALGASEVVDYTEDVAAAIRLKHPDGVAGLIYLLHPPTNFSSIAALVRTGGNIATTVHAADVDALAAEGITAANLVAASDPLFIERLGELARSGVIKPQIECTYPLEGVTEGFLHIAGGTARGKLSVAVEPQ